MTDREKLLRRIKALLDKTVAAGCPVDEALASLAKAKELIEEYGVTDAELASIGATAYSQRTQSQSSSPPPPRSPPPPTANYRPYKKAFIFWICIILLGLLVRLINGHSTDNSTTPARVASQPAPAQPVPALPAPALPAPAHAGSSETNSVTDPIIQTAHGNIKHPYGDNGTPTPAPVEPKKETAHLKRWIGKYPNGSADRANDMSAVDSAAFLDDPVVARIALKGLSPAPFRRMGTSAPIEDVDGWLVASGCQPHDCKWSNWMIAINLETLERRICLADDNDTKIILLKDNTQFTLPLMSGQDILCPEGDKALMHTFLLNIEGYRAAVDEALLAEKNRTPPTPTPIAPTQPPMTVKGITDRLNVMLHKISAPGGEQEYLWYVADTYTDNVTYYGKVTSKQDVLEDKRKFMAKWPDRSYSIRPGSLTVTCAPPGNVCTANGIVDFTVQSNDYNRRITGSAEMIYVMQMRGEGAFITREDGKVLERRFEFASADGNSCPYGYEAIKHYRAGLLYCRK